MGGFNDFSSTASSNASIGSINFSEGQLPSTVNNSARQLIADLADVRDGNVIGTGWHIKANGAALHDQSDTTKKVIFDVSAVSTGSTRTLSWPNTAGTVALLTDIPSAGTGISIASQTVSIDPSYLRGYLSGLTLSNNGSDATNDIDIAVGVAVDSTSAKLLKLTGALTKRLDASWAVGTNQGGLDTGSIADTTYHVWLIMRSDTGVVDVLFSTSASSPTMPTNYDYKRRIGSIIRASSAIVVFTQKGDEFLRDVPVLDSTAAITTTASTITLSIPTGVKMGALVSGGVANSNAGGIGFLLSSPDVTDTAAASNGLSTGQVGTNNYSSFVTPIRTNTSAQIRARSSAASNVTLYLTTFGWIDRRGRDD